MAFNSLIKNNLERKNYLFKVLLSLLFGIAYMTIPNYGDGSNVHYLRGLAAGGYGYLSNDEFVKSKDAFPIFSQIVELSFVYGKEFLFYIYHCILVSLFFFWSISIANYSTGIQKIDTANLVIAAIIFAINSIFIENFFIYIFNFDLIYHLNSGLADQFLLYKEFIPSLFGVFLVGSIYFFLKNKIFISCLLISLSAYLHFNYLFIGAYLTISYMIIIYFRDGLKKAFLLGFFTLLSIIPLLIYVYLNFVISDSALFERTQHFMAYERLPHHADISRWMLDKITIAKVLLILIGIAFLFIKKQKKLLIILSTVFIISLVLTLIQIISSSLSLALMFPWRSTVILVPLILIILISHLTRHLIENYLGSFMSKKILTYLSIVSITFFLLTNFYFEYRENINKKNKDFYNVVLFIKANSNKNDLYAIEIRDPLSGKFRLSTGAKLFVDFTAVPYDSIAISSWLQRYDINNKIFSNLGAICDGRYKFNFGEITHLIVKNSKFNKECNKFEEIYKDNEYSIIITNQ